jgi:NAD(P)-dependent dehydrogenase (short-subunit alcohol dehydrogenase family)
MGDTAVDGSVWLTGQANRGDTVELDLKGKRALVTGGSRGIGKAIVLQLAQHGASVAAGYTRDSDEIKALDKELAAFGNDSHVVQADVSDPAAVEAMVQGVRDRFDQIDIVVNNAGVVSHRTIEDLDLAEWDRVLNTNLKGIFMVVKAALPAIPEGGSIINITSAVGLKGMVARTHYTSSKAGVIGFTRSLAKEVGPRGIRVNAVAPGIIETDQVSGLTEEGKARYKNMIGLGRIGQPDDIAGPVLFLASDLSRYVNGETLVVDGCI